MLFAAPQAFSATLVKNTEQATNSRSSFTVDLAQGFRTGGHADGYTLTFVRLDLQTGGTGATPVFSVGIWSESGGGPNQSLGTLTSSSGNTFTHTGIDLLPNTAYFVVVDVSTTGRSVSWANTRSDDEDARKAPGWSIFNMSHSRGINASSWGTFSQSRKIRVNGDLKGTSNTPPVARAGSVRTNEDTDYTFTKADFRFADADSGDALEGVTIVTLPASGRGALTLSGSEVSANDAVTKTQLDNGNLKYNPPANANGDAYTSFGFKVSDGTVESLTAYDMTINVRPVNDSPTGDLAIQGTAKLGSTLTVDISGLADVDGLPTNADDFTVNWQHADTIGTNIASDTRTYTLTSSDVGENLRVEVKYEDREGTDETVVLDSWPGTGTVLGNTAPTASDGTVTMDQDTQYTFTAANFNFSDADSTDTLASVTIVAPPASGKGTLTLSGSSVSANDSVSSTDIAAGNLKYAPPGNASGDDYASFTFKVSDGADASANSYTMTIDVADTAAPTVSFVTAESSSLVVTFNEPLAAAASLANSAFAVKKTPSGGSEGAVSLSGSPSISGAAVTLTLATALVSTDAGVKVSYTKPTSGANNKLADAAGNEVASFADRTVSSPELSISVSSSSIAEAAGTSIVTVGTGAGPTFSSNQTITLTLSGTATVTDDYTISSTSLTLAAGAASITATVTAVDDNYDDDAETVVIDAAIGQTAVGAQQSITITDDDAAPALSISVSSGTVAEDGETSSRVTVGTGAGSVFETEQTITLTLSGTATQTDDYTISSESLTLAAGATSVTATVTAVDDNYDDDAETVLIDAAIGQTAVGAQQSITITDDDAAPALSISVSSGTVAEDGETSSTVTFSLGAGSVFETDQTITLALTGTASKNDDYTISGESLPLAADATSVTATVTAVDDNYDDDAETILVTASNGGDSIGPATVTITDDDAAPVLSISVSSGTVAEDGETSSTVTVSLGAGSVFETERTITLTLSGTATQTDDYTISGESLPLAADATSVTATVTAVDDNYDDDAETVLIDVAIGQTAVGAQQSIMITDDDAAPVLSVSVNNASVAEAAGTSTVTVRTGSGSTFEDDQTITLTRGGTATTGDDYTIGSTSLTLPAGVDHNVSEVTTTITAVQDKIDDDAETIIVNAALGSGLSATAIGSATVTIADDDGTPEIAFTVSDASISEAGGTSTVTVSTGNGSTFATARTFPLALVADTATEGADFTLLSKSLTLPAGTGTTASSIATTVTAVQDRIDEADETILIDVIVPGGGGFAAPRQRITITDDDAAPVLSLDVSSATIAEAAGTSTVTVGTGTGSTFATDQTITLALGGTATVIDDYSIGATTLTLPAGAGTAASEIATTITAVDDDFFEGVTHEQLTVAGTHGGASFGATRSVTITENEAAPKLTVSFTDDSISENGGSTAVTASVSPRTVDAFTATFAATPDAPATAADYDLTGTVSFAALSATPTGTVTITANNNRVDRPDKSVSVTATGSQSYFRATDAATLTIEDEDAAPAPVLEVSDASIAENAGVATVTVTTGGGSTFPEAMTVTLAMTGAAGENADYTILSKSLTLPAGSGLDISMITTTVTGVDDIIDDDAEDILIDAAIGQTAVGTRQSITITDDDAAPAPTISVSPGTIDEDGGTSTVTVTTGAGSTYATDQAVTLTLSGTATATGDYSLDTTLTLSAGVGLTASSVETTATGVDDIIDDDAETILIDAAIGQTAVGTRQSITITDDDAAPVLVFTALPASIAENGGVSTVTVGTGTGSTYATEQTITLSLADTGTAIEGADYTIGARSLTLPAGVGSSASSVETAVTGLDDGLFEGEADQTVLVTATHAGTPVGSARTVAVVDDEANSQVVLKLDPDSIGESDVRGTPGRDHISQITATVSPPAEHAFVVDLEIEPNAPATAADYTTALHVPSIGLLDFAAGATQSTGLAFITAVDNDADTPDKTLTVSGSVSGFDPVTLTLPSARTTGILAPADATLTIRDDDQASGTVALSVDLSAAVAEDAGATSIEVTATLGSGARESDVAVTVTVGSGTGDAGAESGIDFEPVADFSLTIAAGDTSASASFSLTPLDDRIDEPDETLRLTGASADPLVGVPEAVEIAIADNDDAPELVFTALPASIAEDGGVSTVTVGTGAGSTFADEQTIALSVSGTATTGEDYTISAQTLTLPAGAGTEASSVAATLTALDDNIDDDAETVVIGALLDGDAVGAEQTVTIDDDDGTPEVLLVLTPPSIAEDGGTSTVTATVSPASATAFTVAVASAPVSPAVAGDFEQSGTTLSFAAGAALSTGSVTIAAVDNAADTPNRQVSVSGTVSAPGVSAPPDATLTILDDDQAPVLTLGVAPASIAEDGGTATVTVSTGTGSTFDSAQAIALALGGTATRDADYTLSATELTLPAGASSVTATLTGLDDGVFEGDETVLVSGLHNGAAFGVARTVTIHDDEAAPAVTLVLTPDSIGEDGGTSTVTATVSPPSTEPFTVTVAVEPNAPAAARDFELSGGTLSFAGNATASTGEVTIAAVDNDVDAADKTLRVSGAVSRGDVTAPADATLTIVDDDEASSTVTLTVAPERLDEGAGATAIEVTGALDSGARESDTVISLSAGGGAATPGVDYEPVADFSLTIPANETSATATFMLAPLDDRIDEADETVILTGIAASAGIGVPEAIGIAIADNDDAPVLALAVDPATIAENGGTATVTVTTGGGSTFADERPIALAVAGTATRGEDYRLESTTVTLPAGTGIEASTATVTLTGLDDGIAEADETVVIGGTVDGAAFGTHQTVTITDDDDAEPPAITLVLTPASIGENAGVSTVTATVTPASSEAFAVTVSAEAVDPAVADDFTLSGARLMFAADATESTGEVTIAAVDNDEDAPDKTVTVSGTVSLEGVTAPPDATLTITDDDVTEPPVDTPALALVLSPASIGENAGVSTVTATVSPASAEAFTVTVSAVAVDPAVAGDFTLSGATLSFAAAATQSTGEVMIAAVDNDEDAPDKTVTVSGTVSLEGVTAPPDAALTITDDDVTEPPVDTPALALVLSPASIGENAGVSTVTATVTPASSEAFAVTVSAEAVDPAVAGDFTLSGATLMFAAEATQSTGEVTIAAVDNDEDAPDKTVTVSGTVSLEGVTAPPDATLTITDDDGAVVEPPPVERGVDISSATPTIVEGDETGGSYSVKLTAEPSEDVTVTVSAPAGSGLTVEPARLTFTPDDWQVAQDVKVTAAANDDADDRTVTLTHAATGAGYDNVAIADVAIAVTDRIDPELPTLSIADARGREADGQLVFNLTLNRTAQQPVSVQYATRDGTAKAAEDYEALAGTASIAAGESTARIVVPLHIDLFSEPDETFALMLSRADGARLADAQATGTIEDATEDGAASQQWLARFGRVAGGQVMAVIGEQIASNRGGESQVTLAGTRLTGGGANPFGAPTAGLDRFGQGGLGLAPSAGWNNASSLSAAGWNRQAQPGETPWRGDSGIGGAGGIAGGLGTPGGSPGAGFGASGAGFGPTATRTMSGRELLANSAFLLNAGPGGGNGVAVWGRGAYTRFDNLGEGIQTGGDAVTATVGVDWACARCLLGIALSHTVVDATYGAAGEETGELESTVTGLYPYFGAQLTERFSVWGLVGQGEGELIATPTEGRAVRVDLESGLAGLGARGEIVVADNGFTLAVKTDALVARTSTGQAEEILEAEGEYRRVRLGLEGAWLRELGENASLRSSLEVAAREDAGDGLDGRGVEVAGALKFIDVAPGLSLDLGVRGLVSHESEDFEEWGVSGGFRYDPEPESAAGPRLSLSHSRGPAGSGGLQQALWQNNRSRPLAPSPGRPDGQPDGQLSAEFAYGFDAFGALGVPWARVGTTGAGKEYRLGYSLFTHRGTPSLELGQSAFAREYRMGWEFSFRCRVQVAVEVLHTAPTLGEKADTGFQIKFRSVAPGGGSGGASCETPQPLFASGAPR